MNLYVDSKSFDMAVEEDWILSGRAESAEKFAENAFIEGYEIFYDDFHDIAIVKYPEQTYMVFRLAE